QAGGPQDGTDRSGLFRGLARASCRTRPGCLSASCCNGMIPAAGFYTRISVSHARKKEETMTRIRRPDEADRSDWERLYAGYAEFYKVAQTQQMRAHVWNWIQDPAHSTEGFVAEQDGRLVGLAHFRAFARPLSAS